VAGTRTTAVVGGLTGAEVAGDLPDVGDMGAENKAGAAGADITARATDRPPLSAGCR
jgi:hypothetical protein